MHPVYAIGDIHGQLEMLEDALALIAADGGPDAQIIFLGDYTDRGPNSMGVVKELMQGRDAGRNWTYLKGNHDRMFSNFLRYGIGHDPRVKSNIHWLNPRLGGTATLASYGVTAQLDFAKDAAGLEQVTSSSDADPSEALDTLLAEARKSVPEAHLDFLDSLPLTYQTDDLLLVHAGLRPAVPLADQDPEDLIWIRDGFLDSDYDFGHLVVHGHTALDHPAHFGNRVDLDGGAGYGRPLVPTVFEGRDCWVLTENGRVPLRP